jgi:hypothetical protein
MPPSPQHRSGRVNAQTRPVGVSRGEGAASVESYAMVAIAPIERLVLRMTVITPKGKS